MGAGGSDPVAEDNVQMASGYTWFFFLFCMFYGAISSSCSIVLLQYDQFLSYNSVSSFF